MTPSQEVASDRIRQAMRLIETAQHRLDDAARAIFAVQGLTPEWRRIGRLYDAVKASWYVLERRLGSGRFDLDRDAQSRLGREPARVSVDFAGPGGGCREIDSP